MFIEHILPYLHISIYRIYMYINNNNKNTYTIIRIIVKFYDYPYYVMFEQKKNRQNKVILLKL